MRKEIIERLEKDAELLAEKVGTDKLTEEESERVQEVMQELRAIPKPRANTVKLKY